MHDEEFDSAIVWMNSAETFVDIFNPVHSLGKNEQLVSWVTESGVMEFFIYANSVDNGGPKRMANKLATITGF